MCLPPLLKAFLSSRTDYRSLSARTEVRLLFLILPSHLEPCGWFFQTKFQVELKYVFLQR